MSLLKMFNRKHTCWAIIKRFFPNSEYKNKIYSRIIEKYISKSDILLDAGCGTGKETLLNYKEKVKFSIGIDISPGIEENNTIHKKVLASVYNMPLHNGCVDIIVCQELIEHLEWPDKFFKEVARILKPQGIFIMMTPNLIGWRSLISKFTPYRFHVLMNKELYNNDKTDVFLTYYKANTFFRIKKLLYGLGFEIIENHCFEETPGTLAFSTITTYLEIIYTKIIRRYHFLRYLRGIIIIVSKNKKK